MHGTPKQVALLLLQYVPARTSSDQNIVPVTPGTAGIGVPSVRLPEIRLFLYECMAPPALLTPVALRTIIVSPIRTNALF